MASNIEVIIRGQIAQSIVAERLHVSYTRGDSKSSVVGQVKKRRQADASIIIHEAEKRGMVHVGIEIQYQRRRSISGRVGRVQSDLAR